MPEIYLDSQKIILLQEGEDVRVKGDGINAILSNSTMDELTDIISKNYHALKSEFEIRLNTTEEVFSPLAEDYLEQITLKLVVEHLYMYCSWRDMYPKRKDQSITWKMSDLSGINTRSTLMSFLKSKYRLDWKIYYRILLSIEPDALEDHLAYLDAYFTK